MTNFAGGAATRTTRSCSAGIKGDVCADRVSDFLTHGVKSAGINSIADSMEEDGGLAWLNVTFDSLDFHSN